MSSSIDKLIRTRARAEGVPPAADYRHGSSDGEVVWWWVGCHGEGGEVVDASIFALLHSVC